MLSNILNCIKDIATNNPTVVSFIKRSPSLHRFVNKLMINSVVSGVRARPHPWSTKHAYTSWDSLSDKTWSGRHLPESKVDSFKSTAEELAKLFEMDGEQKLSDKSTCLFPAFAQHLTDGFIRTVMPHSTDVDDEARLKNTSNHDIDLSPLYGRTSKQTDALRQKSNTQGEKGRLKTQRLQPEGQTEYEEFAPFLFKEDGEFSDPAFRDLDPPLGLSKINNIPALKLSLFAFGGDRANAAPQVSMINTLLLREHNRIAGKLEKENLEWDDERVFQTARNALIALYIKVVVEDYINHISPRRLPFLADPKVAWTANWNRPNWITTEFSLLYRWHSLVPMKVTWGGKDYDTRETILNNQPFIQNGLKRSLLEVSSQPAAQLGVMNTAPSLLPLEEAAIKQGRFARLQSYNQYRDYVSLPNTNCFENISSNPKVVQFLKDHYDSVDDVEFYSGMFAEDLTVNSPLPELLISFVGLDAFTQALTNPLLSKPVFTQKELVFGKAGWQAIVETATVRDIVIRNCGALAEDEFVGMTQPAWTHQG